MVNAFLPLSSLWLLAACALAAKPTQSQAPLPSGTPKGNSTGSYKPQFDCGTSAASHASHHFNQTIQQLHQNGSAQGAPGAQKRANALWARQSIPNINAHFHVVSTQANANLITQDMVNKQLSAMNSAYAPYNIQFTLASSDFTVNDDWAVGADSDSDTAMKTSLRKGTYQDLNIYFQTDMAGGNLGQCSLPTSIGSQPVDPSVYVADGCNVNANTMPDGQFTEYNYGGTAIHETGHWLGLLHTFEGDTCDGSGDYIDDTPSESQSTDGCPVGKNSCSDRSGVDPIHNYMDYSYDTCYEAFTDGQHARMQQLWGMYRAGN